MKFLRLHKIKFIFLFIFSVIFIKKVKLYIVVTVLLQIYMHVVSFVTAFERQERGALGFIPISRLESGWSPIGRFGTIRMDIQSHRVVNQFEQRLTQTRNNLPKNPGLMSYT